MTQEKYNNLYRALSGKVMKGLKCSEKGIDTLTGLLELNLRLKKLKELGREKDVSEEVNTINDQVNKMIKKVDEDYNHQMHSGSDETPGELCSRLIQLNFERDDVIVLQNDATVSDIIRQERLDEVDKLQALKVHLQERLDKLLKNEDPGPSEFSYTTSQNPYYNPDATKIIPHTISGDINHIIGLACTGHGASLTYMGRDGTIRSSVFDRWAGTKYTFLLCKDEIETLLGKKSQLAAEMHDLLEFSYGRFPRHREFETDFPKWMDWMLKGLDVSAEDIDLFVSGDSLFVTSAYSLGEEMNRWFPNASIVMDIEHHVIHQCQAFWPSGFKEAAVVTIDTCGEDLARLNGRKIAGTISIMDQSGRRETIREFLFPRSSAGLIYAVANHHIGYAQGQEGKTMGLAPYGGTELYDEFSKYLRLYPDGSFDFISNKEIHAILDAYEYERPRKRDAEFTKKHENIAYAAQTLIEDILTNTFKAALQLTGQKNLVYAGGVALNSVANEVAYKAAGPERIYISPNPSDCGQALGFALYGAYELAGWEQPQNELTEYLGPMYTPDEVKSAAESSRYYAIQPEDPVGILVKCIANGHITARFAGPAEFGPRALGNRSILVDPGRKDMKDYLNSRVKHREGFRPFAPTVLIEHVSDWFDMKGRSPHMLRVVNVPDGVRDKIPAIVHVDGTARVQTVDKDENREYWDLINRLYELTDVPVVLNTSFNVGGKPIVETPEDAVACFESTEIDVLFLEGWILSKKPVEAFTEVAR